MTAISRVYALIQEYRAKNNGVRPETLWVEAELYRAAFCELSAMTARAVGGDAQPSDTPSEEGYVLYGVTILPLGGGEE